MTRKSLLTASLLLPLIAISGVAFAQSTREGNGPNRHGYQGGPKTVVPHVMTNMTKDGIVAGVSNDAYAQYGPATRARSNGPVYHGGPKY